MRIIAAVGLTLGLLGPVQAQTVTDLTGTWQLEAATTRALSDGVETRMVARRVTLTAMGDRLTVDRVVGGFTLRTAYSLTVPDETNQGLRGEPRASTARTEGAVLVFEDRETVPQPAGTATVAVTERWTSQPDGALRIDITSVTSGATLSRTYRYVRANQ